MSLELWSWFTDKWRDEKNMVIEKKNDYEFPCTSDKCLVRAACTKACEKIEMEDDKLMKLFLRYNACPDCGSESFKEGPSGGAAQNVKCNGCGHWFNFGLPLFIQRIHVGEGGRFYE
jgi:hypothetical protein